MHFHSLQSSIVNRAYLYIYTSESINDIDVDERVAAAVADVNAASSNRRLANYRRSESFAAAAVLVVVSSRRPAAADDDDDRRVEMG